MNYSSFQIIFYMPMTESKCHSNIRFKYKNTDLIMIKTEFNLFYKNNMNNVFTKYM